MIISWFQTTSYVVFKSVLTDTISPAVTPVMCAKKTVMNTSDNNQ